MEYTWSANLAAFRDEARTFARAHRRALVWATETESLASSIEVEEAWI